MPDLIWIHSFNINAKYSVSNAEIRHILSEMPNLIVDSPQKPVDINVLLKVSTDRAFDSISIVIWHYDNDNSIKLVFSGNGTKEPDILRKKIDLLGPQIVNLIESKCGVKQRR